MLLTLQNGVPARSWHNLSLNKTNAFFQPCKKASILVFLLEAILHNAVAYAEVTFLTLPLFQGTALCLFRERQKLKWILLQETAFNKRMHLWFTTGVILLSAFITETASRIFDCLFSIFYLS